MLSPQQPSISHSMSPLRNASLGSDRSIALGTRAAPDIHAGDIVDPPGNARSVRPGKRPTAPDNRRTVATAPPVIDDRNARTERGGSRRSSG